MGGKGRMMKGAIKEKSIVFLSYLTPPRLSEISRKNPVSPFESTS